MFRHIEKKDSWVALCNIQTDPVCRGFLWDVIKSTSHLADHQENVFDVRGFVFISTPPSGTPFHIGCETNLWKSIRGRKTISFQDREDREVVSTRDVENFIMYRSLDAAKLKGDRRARSHDFDCGPSNDVHFRAAHRT